jgi:hypothetical protein
VFDDLTIERTKAEEKEKKKTLEIKINTSKNSETNLPAKLID